MRIRAADSRLAEDARTLSSTPPESKSPFGRLSKKSSVAQMLGSAPNSPAATPVIPPSNLGTLENLPTPVLLRIMHICAPDLRRVRRISHGYRELVEKYIAKRTKRFQESIEEAECWGGRPPTLTDLVQLDPLALENILDVYYSVRLTDLSGESIADASERGPISEIDDDFDMEGDFGQPKSQIASAAPARTIKRPMMQKIVFDALRQALDSYDQGCWATLSVLRKFIIRHGLQYSQAEVQSEPRLIVSRVDDDQSERDVSDGASIRSVKRPCIVLTPSGDAVNSVAKDATWLRLNAELYRLAALHGHAFNLPPLSDVEDPPYTIAQAADLSVRSQLAGMLVACLDSARLYGCLWPTLQKGLQAALSCFRVGRRVPVDVVLVLLDTAFNDPFGPWTYCSNIRGWGYQGYTKGEDQIAATARELLLTAEECAKAYGLAWHRLGIRGEYVVVPVEEVAREIRSRVKIMM